MKLLALDISTKTGWALFEWNPPPFGANTYELLDYGLIAETEEEKAKFSGYPLKLFKRVDLFTQKLVDKVVSLQPDIVVVEETNGGGGVAGRYTQKQLEYLHYAILDKLYACNITDIKYVSTSEWRKTLNLRLTKDQKKSNQKLSQAKSKAKKDGKELDKKTLKIKGKITWKHLSVQMANEVFGLALKQKQNDESDALLLGLAYMKGANICDGK